ncbi:biotin-dependent carboxyltransferase family protein [Haloglycomyces albus]|uniref:5-oxoprolinase subunit C family protein n=1 Tax=Haloglycomyces albus TaxID=526067 RepID=UPI00046CE351|nr:biotin-dependent carboxyltransferase family protein [Haloglycomyces albus]
MTTGAAAIEILRAGALTTCQDVGRAGWAHLAVPPSGAADVPSWRLANQLAGNTPHTCALETTLNGVTLTSGRTVAVVVGGAPCPVTVNDQPEPWGQPVTVHPGDVLDVGVAEQGVRSYVAFSGGLYPKASLGSHSTCLLSGLGPDVLRKGDRIPLGPRPYQLPLPTQWPAPWPGIESNLVLKLYLGPRHDWLTAEAKDLLSHGEWRVSEHSNRVGLRLDGPALEHSRSDELPSEGIVTGSLQLPPNGKPVLFGPDHPTTGGYPVVGVVDRSGIAAAAQARPGTRVRFAVIDPPLWVE